MPRVIINRTSKRDENISLTNGSLVVLSDEYNVPISTYIVTSYRGNDHCKPRHQYCTLINLSNGCPAFEEPSSRSTTIGRLINHIYNGKISHPEAKPAKYSENIKVLNKDDYIIGIDYSISEL